MSSPPLTHPGRVKHKERLRSEKTAPYNSLPGKPPDYQPPKSHRSDNFTDDDDWYSIAQKYNVDASGLIQFNFKTTDPGVVNYWLRVLVGCDTATADLTNWKFSSTAKRPWVYIPYEEVNEDPTVITAPTVHDPVSLVFKGPGSWAMKWLRENCNKPETWGLPKDTKAWDVTKWVVSTFRGGEKGLVKTGVKSLGLMGACALSDTDPILNLVVPAFKEGIGLGFVLGADQRLSWRLNADYHDYPGRFDHPEYGLRDEMNKWYQLGLNAGADRGWQLSKDVTQTHDLFVWLNSQISDFAKSYFGFDQSPTTDWSHKKWSDYYHQCGKIMETKIMIQ